MKVCIIRLSSIGDIVMITPVIRCCKLQLKDAEVHLVTKIAMKDVSLANPYIDKLHYFIDNLESLIEQLKLEEFDVVIDLHNNLRSKRIRVALHKKTITVKKYNWQRFLLTKLHIDCMPKLHVTQRCFDVVKEIGIVDDGKGLDFFIEEGQILPVNDIPASHQAGYICMVIGANHFTKKFPVEKWIELCKRIQHPIILIGGEAERQEGALIAATDDIKIYNSCGKFSLQESADLIRKSKLVIANDTGFQHIAAAFQKPLISLWGGTSPLLGMEPYYGTNNHALHHNIYLNLWCQPCSKYGLKSCPLGHFKCMRKLDVDNIVNMVYQRLR